MPSNARDRHAELDAIRATYARYADSGRDRIWSDQNLGFRLLREQRDARLVELLTRSIPTNGRVLDAGCGSGDLAGLVHGQRPDVQWVGVDLLPESIAVAQRRYSWAKWVVGSADALSLPERSMHAIVAETLFSSLPSRAMEQDVAAEFARVLKPGGWLIWYDLRHDSPRNSSVHGIQAADLAELFPGWSLKLDTVTLVPPLARRLGRSSPVLYPLLHTLPFLRSHLIGRLRRPQEEEAQ
jgi:SAM-dependent methyltransferase